ncbi:hypothetical protein [uncultured Methylibium sp.]|uniref:hypothetical protein n=1 Tax=uncultured Methylibium sp. TaxID=381093 RepID=UPI0025CDBDB8|nr:hypothetical protein [uncultured Methylibium sp.]
MSSPPEIIATPWKESSGTCDCCGRTSKTVWGDLSVETTALATYFVRWTVDAPEHDVNVDLVIGAWGEGTTSQDRVLVSVLYRPSSEGGSFMVIDGESRHAATSELCGRAMRRAEVVGTPFAQEVFSLLDGLWLTDPRISEIRAFNDLA